MHGLVGVSWCANNSVKDWFEGWMGLCPAAKSERVWLSLFGAVTWTIWEFLNKKIFDDKEPNLDQAADMVKFRVVWWYKHFGTNVSDSISVLMLNVKELCVETKRVKKSLIKDWIPPLMGTFKFNVDGSARGSPGMAGIGGVLRDSKGKVVCLFSLGVGIMDSNSAEILAIKKAVELCQLSPLLRGRFVDQ
ncbi:hypothetical protein Dsin_020481 [Dipteronia sinensis]|uniref:RNase H type-1 domain-containing protein n=1 Tax=Dipteronia sinensis TaxID=43782 RepID=A0AAE0A9J7_9ROSI|nr:hypothetical protein Dsin_020481 [Dipteronia sinensis]